MAKVLGKAGRYVEDQSLKKSQKFIRVCIIAIPVSGILAGFFLAVSIFMWNRAWISLPVLFMVLVAVYIADRQLKKKVAALDKERINFRKGAVGEHLIAGILKTLPDDDYVVINDLTTRYGNLDHVVIGLSGIFAIDTKNWKGVVESDNNGELLLNGNPTTKPAVKNFVRTVMLCREQIINLCHSQQLQNEPYVRVVLAFPSAFVKAKWGTVKNVDCVTDETLCDYIIKNKSVNNLTKQEIGAISRAFLALAQMEKNFTENRA